MGVLSEKQLFQGAIVALLKEGSSTGCFCVKIAHTFCLSMRF